MKETTKQRIIAQHAEEWNVRFWRDRLENAERVLAERQESYKEALILRNHIDVGDAVEVQTYRDVWEPRVVSDIEVHLAVPGVRSDIIHYRFENAMSSISVIAGDPVVNIRKVDS